MADRKARRIPQLTDADRSKDDVKAGPSTTAKLSEFVETSSSTIERTPEHEEPEEAGSSTTNSEGRIGYSRTLSNSPALSPDFDYRPPDTVNPPSPESFPAEKQSDLIPISGSEEAGYTYMCQKTGKVYISSSPLTRADIADSEESVDETTSTDKQTAQVKTKEERFWQYLSYQILEWHARIWFGDEEWDRIALNEHYRSITRYAVVDIVVLVAWVIAELYQQRQHVGDFAYTSSVYTVIFIGSATMLILSFIHVTNKMLTDAKSGQAELNPSNRAYSEDIGTRCQAEVTNAEACPPGYRWKILYMRNLHYVFRPECRIRDIPYTMMSPKRMNVITSILEDLRTIAEMGNEPQSSVSGCKSASQETSVHANPKVSERLMEKNSSGTASEDLVSSTPTFIKENKLYESNIAGSDSSILKNLLSKPPLNEKRSTGSGSPSASSSSRRPQDEQRSAQDTYGDVIKQKLTAWLKVVRSVFGNKVRVPQMEPRKLDPKDKAKTRYSCIKRQRKKALKPLAELSSVVSGRLGSETFPEDRILSPGDRKRLRDSLSESESPTKQIRPTKGKTSMSLQYRYKKGTKSSETKTHDTASVERSLPPKQSGILGRRSRSLPDGGESTSSGEAGALSLREFIKRSKLQSSTEGPPGPSEDVESVTDIPLELSSPSRLVSSTSSNFPVDENETSVILIIPDTTETEYVIRRVPASFQCEEIDPPPEIELLLTVLGFLDNLGGLIRSANFNRSFLHNNAFLQDVLAIKASLRQCYEILRSSVRDKGIPLLPFLEGSLQTVLVNINPVVEELNASPAILEALSRSDEQQKLKDLY